LTIQDSIKIEAVSPITLEATRWYEEWVVVRIQTDQGIEGIGEGFTWSGQALEIRAYIDTIGNGRTYDYAQGSQRASG
tara:strand:+ start:2891 stop:3124 length:234 start_codon:yes stop_codon:yes gene_type:complete